jgi:hypothetical protein
MPYTSLLLQVSSVVNELGLEARGSVGDATERPSLARRGRSVTSAQTKAMQMVELAGIEPATPWLQTRCSPS